MIYASDKSQFFIVGAGAIGLLLAWEYSAYAKNRPWVFSRRSGATKVFIQKKAHKSDHEFYCDVQDFQDLNAVLSNCFKVDGSEHVFFFCVPAAAIPDTLSKVLASYSSGVPNLPSRIHCVFVSNGILDAALIQNIVAQYDVVLSRLFTWRAVFYVGAMRFFERDRLYLAYKGGHRIVVGPYLQMLAQRSSHGDQLQKEQRLPGIFLNTDILEWHCTNDVIAAEIVKFFVNFCIAFAFKNNAIPNRLFYQYMNQEQVFEWIQHFQNLWSEITIPNADYTEALKYTLEFIGDNTNSISLAWSQGDDSLFRNFLGVLIRRAHKKNLLYLVDVFRNNYPFAKD